tara:strand:+ start:155 stop:394 length:240 start_codon:yes stop_codon:yes gene_type:complete
MSVEDREEKFSGEVATAITVVHEFLPEAPTLPAVNELMLKLECVLALQEDAILRLRKRVPGKETENVSEALGVHGKSTR